jgi:putative multicomponent Na+:H+ antiporter subunit B
MDKSLYIIAALLPLAAAMLVFQVNPYHALVIRGVLGAIAALMYTVFGAPDVALTEALVGTLLAITLYAVAVRSSLVFRLGVLQTELTEASNDSKPAEDRPLSALLHSFTTSLAPHHLRIELVPYGDRSALQRALLAKDVHATCAPDPDDATAGAQPLGGQTPPYRTVTRVRRLYEILHGDVPANLSHLDCLDPATTAEVTP